MWSKIRSIAWKNRLMELRSESLGSRTGKWSVLATITLLILSLAAWIIFLTGFAIRNHWTVAELDRTFVHDYTCWWGLIFTLPVASLVLFLYSFCCNLYLGIFYFILAQVSLIFAGAVANNNAQRMIAFYNQYDQDEYFGKFVLLEFSAVVLYLSIQMLLFVTIYTGLMRKLHASDTENFRALARREVYYSPIEQ